MRDEVLVGCVCCCNTHCFTCPDDTEMKSRGLTEATLTRTKTWRYLRH